MIQSFGNAIGFHSSFLQLCIIKRIIRNEDHLNMCHTRNPVIRINKLLSNRRKANALIKRILTDTNLFPQLSRGYLHHESIRIHLIPAIIDPPKILIQFTSAPTQFFIQSNDCNSRIGTIRMNRIQIRPGQKHTIPLHSSRSPIGNQADRRMISTPKFIGSIFLKKEKQK